MASQAGLRHPSWPPPHTLLLGARCGTPSGSWQSPQSGHPALSLVGPRFPDRPRFCADRPPTITPAGFPPPVCTQFAMERHTQPKGQKRTKEHPSEQDRVVSWENLAQAQTSRLPQRPAGVVALARTRSGGLSRACFPLWSGPSLALLASEGLAASPGHLVYPATRCQACHSSRDSCGMVSRPQDGFPKS